MTTSIATTASTVPGETPPAVRRAPCRKHGRNARRRRRTPARSLRPQAQPQPAARPADQQEGHDRRGHPVHFHRPGAPGPRPLPGQSLQNHRHGVPGARRRVLAGHHRQGPGRPGPHHPRRTQLPVRGPDRGLRLDVHRHPGGPGLGLLRQVHRRGPVPHHQRVPAPARAAAPGDPGRVPAAGPGHRDPGPGGHRLGRLGPGAALAGTVHPVQGLRGRGRGHR